MYVIYWLQVSQLILPVHITSYLSVDGICNTQHELPHLTEHTSFNLLNPVTDVHLYNPTIVSSGLLLGDCSDGWSWAVEMKLNWQSVCSPLCQTRQQGRRLLDRTQPEVLKPAVCMFEMDLFCCLFFFHLMKLKGFGWQCFIFLCVYPKPDI